MYNNLAKSDIKKMEEEIEYWRLVVRREALEMVREARAHGDLGENLEYKAAKQNKNRDESHVRYLGKMIKTARITSDQFGADEIGLEDWMGVYIPDDDEMKEYKLVTTVRGSSPQGLISIDSPPGKVIGGHKVGERVRTKAGDHSRYEVKICSIDKTAVDKDNKLHSF